jgi:hypothetical protein
MRRSKINFYKSELFCFGVAQDEVNVYANLFGCGQGPMRYLAIPIHYRRLIMPNGNSSRKDYKSIVVVGKLNYYP